MPIRPIRIPTAAGVSAKVLYLNRHIGFLGDCKYWWGEPLYRGRCLHIALYD